MNNLLLKFRFLFLCVCLLSLSVCNAFGAVESGTKYAVNTGTDGTPAGWTVSCNSSSSYAQLIAADYYILTDEFCQNPLSSITLKARKFGGPSDAQLVISVDWEVSGETPVELGTISPTSTTLSNYSLSGLASKVTANKKGRIRISCKGASSSKGSGVSEVTVNFTAGTCVDCSKKLTINKGAESNGTFTLSKSGELASCSAISTVVTPTPANHYHVSGVTATTPTAGGAPTVSAPDSEGKYTVTYAANSTGSSTINVAFAEDAHATITTSVAGSATVDQTHYVGDTYTLPSSVAAGACGTKVLVGWSTVPVAPTNTKPTSNFYDKGAEVTLAANQTFYAVFADQQGTAPTPATVEADYSSHSGWTLSGDLCSGGSGSSAYWVLCTGGSITSPVISDLSTVTSITFTSRTFGGAAYKTVNVNTSGNVFVGSADASSTSMASKSISVSGLTGSGSLVFTGSATSNANGPGINYIVINYSTGGATYTNYSTSCVTYDVQVEVNNTSYGSASINLGLITAVPAAGYRVKAGAAGYTILEGSATVVNNGNNTFSVSASSDCRIQVNFELIPTFTVNWYVAGTIQHHQTAEEGTPLTGIPAPDVSDCDGEKVFIGWYNNTYSGDVAPAGLITNTTGLTMPAANTDYYAVFASASESTTTFKRATTMAEIDAASKIVILNTNQGGHALTTSVTDGGNLSTDEITPSADLIWTLEKNGSYYKFKAGGQYLGAASVPGSGNVPLLATPLNSDWEIAPSTNAYVANTFYIKNAGGNAALEYYSDFVIYANSSIATQSYFANKLYVPAATYNDYTTACTPCVTNPGWSFATAHAIVMKGAAPYTNVINKTHPSTGYQTWTSSDEAVATVDENGVVTPLIAGTAIITLKLSRKDDICAQTLSYEFEVRDPTLEIVEVKPLPGVDSFGIIIEHDLPGAATITLSQETTHTTSEATTADSLFFSKYFEADGDNKLIALYNGTKDKINLSNYKLHRTQKGSSGVSIQEIELDRFGRHEQGYIYPNEEIIILRYATSNSAEHCTETQQGYENWYVMTSTDGDDGHGKDIHQWLQFSGPQSIGLWCKTANKYIDVIGATNKTTGELMQINASNNVPCPAATISGGDSGGWYTTEGDNVMTEVEENDYTLSTNRCLLIRKKTVKSGMNAANLNKYTSSDDNLVCDNEIAHTFQTLADEWIGYRVEKGSDQHQKTCQGMGFVGGFDYVAYRVTYDTITKDQVLDDIKQPDGTYLIPVPKMKDRACGELKVEIRGAGNTLLNEKQFRVPIIVDANITTNDTRFNAKRDTCKSCDVIILNGATLTKINDTNKHWGDTAYNVDVYAGGKLIVPASKEYRANQLTVRSRVAEDGINMLVPEVVVDGNIAHAVNGISQRMRLSTNRFYAFTLPFEVRLDDISFSSGEPAVYGTDYMIRYYDGESRAASQVASGNWKNFTGDRLNPGVGYTIALAKRDGHTYRELIMPMYGASLVDGEAPDKTQTIFAWGWNTAARANHKGWNYIGNPYMRKYSKNHLDDEAQLKLTRGALVPDLDNDGWYINNEGTVPYVTQINASRTDYSQSLVSATDLPPFTPFFVQVGVGSQAAGDAVSLTYHRENRAAAAPARRTAQEQSSAIVSVLLLSDDAQDNFGVVVGDQYTPDYDMQADLSKEFGSLYSLKAYTLQDADQMRLAFNAINTDRTAQPIPVGFRVPAAGQYAFAIDPSLDLSAFDHVYLTDNQSGTHTDLMDNTYSFSATAKQQIDNRFALTVVLKPKTTPTACGDSWIDHVFAEGLDGRLRLSRLPARAHVYIYDMCGRLMAEQQFTSESNHSWALPVGVYQVRIAADSDSQLVKVIVK